MATVDEIKQLRDMTGAGINAVREALKETGEDIEAALKYLRQKGIAKAEKRSGNNASEGVIGTYIHSNNKVVVVVEVNSETDFAAKGEDMQKFANDVALHIAAMNPRFASVDAVPAEELEKEKDTHMQDLEGKPEEVKERIVEGKLQKFYKDSVLLKQSFFLDDSKTIEDLLNDLITKIGEKIVVKGFSRFEVAKDTVSSYVPDSEESSEEE